MLIAEQAQREVDAIVALHAATLAAAFHQLNGYYTTGRAGQWLEFKPGTAARLQAEVNAAAAAYAEAVRARQ